MLRDAIYQESKCGASVQTVVGVGDKMITIDVLLHHIDLPSELFTQRDFLTRMGILQRMDYLSQKAIDKIAADEAAGSERPDFDQVARPRTKPELGREMLEFHDKAERLSQATEKVKAEYRRALNRLIDDMGNSYKFLLFRKVNDGDTIFPN